jgi:hypothetical protein
MTSAGFGRFLEFSSSGKGVENLEIEWGSISISLRFLEFSWWLVVLGLLRPVESDNFFGDAAFGGTTTAGFATKLSNACVFSGMAINTSVSDAEVK